jgi:hypothetical protein
MHTYLKSSLAASNLTDGQIVSEQKQQSKTRYFRTLCGFQWVTCPKELNQFSNSELQSFRIKIGLIPYVKERFEWGTVKFNKTRDLTATLHMC